MNEAKRLIHSFQKNSSEIVKVYLQTWGPGDYVDIRVWTALRPGDTAGEQPTKKGITLNVDLLPELRTAIDLALAELEVEQQPMSDEAKPDTETPEDGREPF